MTKIYPLSLHIFRRDLRLFDNTGLIEALVSSQQVIPCFIFDTRQIENNSYKSKNCIQFMIHSLRELNDELKNKDSQLYFFYGIAEEIVADLLNQLPIKAVFVNRDYTPFSTARDEKIANICEQRQVDFHSYADLLLNEPEEMIKSNGQPYTIFTPFYKKALQKHIKSPQNNTYPNYYQKPIGLANKHLLNKFITTLNAKILVTGGRKEALGLLKKIKDLIDYVKVRDFPSISGTTLLSAHNKFGTISIREFYYAIKKQFGLQHTLVKELFWRDFFTHVAFNFPHIFSDSFHNKYNKIPWSQNENHFTRWRHGETGFPIVDAGMRELNTTGFMHNRVRMIVASFLTKDLHLNWQWGEKYFAQKLVDYDPAVNNGNWQWAASTGCDAQPYFRIFNPWLQQKKFDPECLYIKKWLPELSAFSSQAIHEIFKAKQPLCKDYPLPMVDHSIASQRAKMMYKML